MFYLWNNNTLASVFQGVLPRGKSPNPLRERNAKVNELVQEAVLSLPHASFLKVDPGFVHSNGSISHHDMYDYLHLTPQGYQAVCEPLHAHLKSMLDKPAENWATSAQNYTTTVVLIPVPREHHNQLINTCMMDQINYLGVRAAHILCKSSSWPGLTTTATDNGTIKVILCLWYSKTIKCAVL